MNKLINYRWLFTCFIAMFCWLLFPKSLAVFSSTPDNQVLLGDLPNEIPQNIAEELLIQGIELYEAEYFDTAKNLWLKSASLYAQEAEVLGEALALNNIATAHQQLGEWESAKKAIAQSLSLLEDRRTLSSESGYWEILAKAYNTKGNNWLNEGKTELALESWQNASQYYLQAHNRAGIIITQINQAKAWQNLGFTVKAFDILEQLATNLLQESNSRLQATGLRHLGISFRELGNLEQSATFLEQSKDLSTTESANSLAWLELGNTQREQGERAREIGNTTQANNYFTQAQKSYQHAQQHQSVSLLAKLNQFSLLVNLGKKAEVEVFLANFEFPQNLKPSRDNIYALLSYGRSLTCLQSQVTNIPLCSLQQQNSHQKSNKFKEAIAITERAIAQSQKIKDPIPEAQAISQLAEIYELQGNYSQALKLNRRALISLQGKFNANLFYRLEWQLGRIYRHRGDIAAATTAYSQAIVSLEKIRDNLLFIDPQAQFSFRDRIEPVYREYAELLLTSKRDRLPNQDSLRQAINAIDALQIAELENFLGCDLSQLVKLDETTVDPQAIQVYPIVLSDRLVTIVEIPGSPLIFRETRVSRSQIEKTVNSLQISLTEPGMTPEVLEHSQQLYHWLIEPLELLIQNHSQSKTKTLVFVPDSILRSIPLSILYDGEQYLVEKDYAIAISPKLELFAPARSATPLKVLTGGVAISQTIEGIDFAAIAQVERELSEISAIINTNDFLLNETFTETNIKEELEAGDFSAIHWKTHGIFSSDPTETFLVAYQDSIKANELQSIVQIASQSGQKPLELLVLSACETAKGDDRAILGLAGLAVRTGTRTALSTLWRADDRATTLLMTKFYQQLVLGRTKAEALREAQLSLLKEEGYFAPYYWGTYILIGNWL